MKYSSSKKKFCCTILSLKNMAKKKIEQVCKKNIYGNIEKNVRALLFDLLILKISQKLHTDIIHTQSYISQSCFTIKRKKRVKNSSIILSNPYFVAHYSTKYHVYIYISLY